MKFSKDEPQSLAATLPIEQARVRALIPIYESCGPGGYFASIRMKMSLDAAERASAGGDVAAMIAALEDLRGWKE